MAEEVEIEEEIFESNSSITEKRWNMQQTKLLAVERMKLEKEFKAGKRKKSVLWGVVLCNIKKVDKDFSYSRKDIQKKFGNLFTTYQRIKKRNKESGRDATLWEHYNTFNEIYGSSYTLDPPVTTLINSFEAPIEITEGEDEIPPKRRNRADASDDILNFLKMEAIKDEERHKEIMESDKRQAHIEQQKVEELRELKELLKQCLDQ